MEEDMIWRAQCYALIAALLSAAPDKVLLSNLATLEITEPDTAMGQAWHKLKQAATVTDEAELAQEYHDLFIGVTQGEVVPYGSFYLSGFLHDKPLAELRKDMAKLGLERQHDVKEPEDHLAAESDVMRLILSAEGTPIVDAATFYQRHLQGWAHKFAQDLQQAPSAKFYLAVGQFLETFFELENLRYK
jgi:TorA maturation chaperone TorD